MFEGGTNAYNNWIEFGGRRLHHERQQGPVPAAAAIQRRRVWRHRGLPFQDDLTKGTTLTLDGRAIFDENDYKARAGADTEKLGYARFSYDQFRTWENGDGGFFPRPEPIIRCGGSALALDHGDISFEAGLTLDNLPKITFKYDHTYRDGQQGSDHLGRRPSYGNTGLARGLGPSFYDIDEHADTFQLDATHQIKATELGARRAL